MKREIERVKGETFDVLVIGGGIHGGALAREAALNGLKVCLIEKDDFGSQTSANSLKVLHGGLRYLQHANFKRMRESIFSRKVFQQIAPHLVKSVPYVIPTSGYTIKSKLALSIAMKLNDMISFDRNTEISEKCFIPSGKTISKKEIEEIIPGIDSTNVTGGAVWYESVALNTERLLFEFLHEAFENGAVLSNYTKAISYNIDKNKISSINVKDELTGEKYKVEAKVVINSVGPWLNEILNGTDDLKYLESPLTKAVSIIIKKNLFGKYAVGLESEKEFTDKAAVINKGKRLFFFVPLGEFTMIGTTYKVCKDTPDNCQIQKQDIQEIIDEVNAAYKTLNLRYGDVTHVHMGTQAMPNVEFENEFDVQADTHSVVFDHSKKGTLKNLISIKSVKYTTAPSIAKNIVEILKRNLSVSQNKSVKNYEEIEKDNNDTKNNFFSKNKNYDSTLLERLWNTYGIRSQNVIDVIEQDEQSQKIIIQKEKIFLGELEYNIEEEMAITLDDILERRLGLTAFEKVPESYRDKIQSVLDDKVISKENLFKN
ncbi:MAG: FAD-dependent oxidoreductase [Ignavibacteriae bacterium]|nr:FAD-dependent oxidoreductase [Ignavibacteriota bacterium]